MIHYIFRRTLIAVPTLLVISFIIFAILDLAPNDPTGNLPMTVPPEVRAKIRSSLGLDEPMHIRFGLWLVQFFINEPLNLLHEGFGISIGDAENRTRVLSWATRSPVVDLIIQRTPQTLWVVGLSYLFGILIAIPIGIVSAYRQYSWFDQVGTFVSMVGFSVPTFFTGMVAIIIFSVQLRWFPMIYDTTLVVDSWQNFVSQVKQMIMPVA
ncbi:MAG: ABC transporter permease, partial [SAR324 cluster bacterium]|nr:ABC transporter permease [SAR324 cluster bacterium]